MTVGDCALTRTPGTTGTAGNIAYNGRRRFVIPMATPQSTTFGHGTARWLGGMRERACLGYSAGGRSCGGRLGRTLAALWLLAASPVWSDTFSGAHYDRKTDELVVTMIYGGSNPDHQFSVQWGECHNAPDGGNMHQIAVEVLDSQWNDVAKQTFTKTVRFSLAGMGCRPAMVTLRTAPKYEMTLQIP
jgi:hypothetical protein